MIRKLLVSLILLEGLLMALLLFTLSCNRQKTDGDTDDALALITMEKTVCFGTCPVYRVQIYANGLADYTGEVHVQKVGRYKLQLPPETIDELIRSFEQADFWSLKDEYVDEITDLPTTYLSFQYKGRYKKVKDRINAPQHLTDLENQIAAITELEGWERTAD